MRSPHLCIMVAAAGLQNAAAELERADDAPAELAAIRCALAMIDGYQLAVRRYLRSMPPAQAEAAATEAGNLRGLEDDLTKRLNELVAREEASHAAAAE